MKTGRNDNFWDKFNDIQKGKLQSQYCVDAIRENENIYKKGQKNGDEGTDRAEKSQTKAKLVGQVLCFNEPKR
jgi:hypothetical protein